MKQMVSKKTATYKKSTKESTIDLIFLIALLSEKLITCKIAKKFDHNSDHQALLLQSTLQTVDIPEKSRSLLSQI